MSYLKIQEYVKKKHGFVPQTCWIAHAKEKCGLKVRRAANRKSNKRKHPCPDNKFPAIKDALRHFGYLKKRK